MGNKKSKRKVYQPAVLYKEQMGDLRRLLPTGFSSDSERVRHVVRLFINGRLAPTTVKSANAEVTAT